MNLKFAFFVSLISTGSFSSTTAQIDPMVKDALIAVLLSKSVSDRIFVDYPEDMWSGAFRPKGGMYAFLTPNRTLRSVYPTILDEMPYTISTDGLLDMRIFYRDSIRSVFITPDMPGKLVTVLEKIQIHSDTAQIDLFTTSYREKNEYKNKYVRVKSNLIRANDQWSITELNIDDIPWTEYFK